MVQSEQGTPKISAALRAFVDEAPHVRRPHLNFLNELAWVLPTGARLLDVGAGVAPYRELFAHVQYETMDWGNSQYSEAEYADITAPADNIPVADSTYDAVINTQVLEHVPEPGRVLSEILRILAPRGLLYFTAPLVWYLHEQPYDYYRYTSHGIRYLLDQAGFVDIEIKPMNNSFATIAQMTAHLGFMMGRTDDGFDTQRDLVARTMEALAPVIESFGNFDTQWILPLGFSAVASRPL